MMMMMSLLRVHPGGAGGHPGGVRALPWLKVLYCTRTEQFFLLGAERSG
jgi:hypothetical protein